MNSQYHPFMSMRHLKKIEAEGPPKPRHSGPEEARQLIRMMWLERNDQAAGKIIWFRLFLLMAVLNIIGWAL